MANPFWELDGYPRESETLTGFTATRKLICDWNDRTFYRNVFMNWPGQLYPYAQSWGARPVNIGIEPFGQCLQDALGADLSWYRNALITVKYATPGYGDMQAYPASKSPTKNLDRRSAISETLEPYLEAVRVDHERFVWSDGKGLSEQEAPVDSWYREKYVLTRHNLLNVPAAVNTLMGTINDAAVTPILVGMDNLTFAARTLLFQPPVINVSAEQDGTPSYDVTYRMVYKPETWWKYGRPAEFIHGSPTTRFETIHFKTLAGGAGTQYKWPPEADFSVIFP